MALESWLASLKPDVTNVTHVTGIPSKGTRCNASEKPAVTHVTDRDVKPEFVTSVTSATNQTLHRKPILGMAVTPVTSVTSEIIVTDTQSDLTQPGEVEVWLRQALDSIQTAKIVEAQAVQLGFSLEQIHTARAAIGVRVSKCLGVEYWRLMLTSNA